MPRINKQEALDYHEQGRRGKIEVVPTKPYSSQRDLSLAYSPGVAEPCLAIEKNKSDAYRYTAKGNLVAVISNGTAVLGLGNIGALASKPVMEGKGVLFKIFADIDVFDIEIDATDIDTFVNTVKAISPTFGGINLEDIKAPEAFEIERRLKEELDIPVMHDDQHGTAIISAAGLINALEIANKKLEEVKIVVSGAGASATSCVKLYVALGARKKNIVVIDSKGVIKPSRTGLSEEKMYFANEVKANNLEEAMVGADVVLGLSKGNVINAEMVKTMAENPIVFALANPTPEIPYEVAKKARKDIIIATGRSDNPNQVNNVLGFPFIFRGALDVRSTSINEAMKLAAVHAIANLAKEPVPEEVNIAYNEKNIVFGRDYIIPKPLDYRLITSVAPAVAKAAMDSGVAQEPIVDWRAYEEELEKRIGRDNKLLRSITQKAKKEPQRIVFAEADNYKILKAAQIIHEEGIGVPILLGNEKKIKQIIKTNNLDLDGLEIIDTRSDAEEERRFDFAERYYTKRKRRGVTFNEALKIMQERNHFGAMLVDTGYGDALISGLTRNYPNTIKPALRIIGKDESTTKLVGMYIIITKQGPLFLADTTVNYNPNAADLASIAETTADAVRKFKIEPKMAMLSYSNFGSGEGDDAVKVREAVAILHKNRPDLIVDGEVQANFALNRELMEEIFPFSDLAKHKTNTLIFPNLAAGNIAYKILQQMSDVEVIGPILLGMKKPVHILQLGSGVREIVNMITIAAVDAQSRKI